MAQTYTAILQGSLYNIPEALPQGLLYSYKNISNISRQNMTIPPNNGQGDVWAGQKIIVTLPTNALIDLSTFTMDFKGIHNIMALMELLASLITVNHDFFLEILNL
jgi:hypothetical protein